MRDLFSSSGDQDGDGTPDYLDADANGDGIRDIEVFNRHTSPMSNRVPESGYKDSDSDGTSNELDGFDDADNDGVPNYLDLDSDNDGLTDQYEYGVSGSVLPDTDADGIDDSAGTDIVGREDLDNDGILDFQDNDKNGNGLHDDADLGTGIHQFPDTNNNGTADIRDTVYSAAPSAGPNLPPEEFAALPDIGAGLQENTGSQASANFANGCSIR